LQSRCGRIIWLAWRNVVRNHRESLSFN
jgi:hypothetical protein